MVFQDHSSQEALIWLAQIDFAGISAIGHIGLRQIVACICYGFAWACGTWLCWGICDPSASIREHRDFHFSFAEYFLILRFGSACWFALRKLVTTELRSVWASSFHALCMVQRACAPPCKLWPLYFGASFGALAYKKRFANRCVFHAGLRNIKRNQVR